MMNNTEKTRKQLIFRAWHRGTREMDLILGSFADQYIPQMSEPELQEFAAFLEISDPELYDWYLGKQTIPTLLAKTDLMDRYLKHKVA